MSLVVVARCRFLLYKNLMLKKSYLTILHRSKTSANILAFKNPPNYLLISSAENHAFLPESIIFDGRKI